MPVRMRQDGDPEHGELVPGLGYYDAGRGVYTSKHPGAAVDGDRRPRRGGDRLRDGRTEFRQDVPTTEELRRRGNAAAFKPSDSMERARKLRDSDREDDRRKFASLSRTTRAEVAGYEDGLRAHLELGRELPEGVRPPAGYEPPTDAA